MDNVNKILLHCCCAPCATAAIKRLINENYEPILYFSNSNIDTKEEYEKRYENLVNLAKFYNLQVIKDDYNHDSWLNTIVGYEKEREGGKRCSFCFYHNLSRSEKKARELDINKFTTTLTVSRFKNSAKIFKVGEKFTSFLPIDFKKQDGFAISCKMAKEMNLYRQNYCGCEFSKER